MHISQALDRDNPPILVSGAAATFGTAAPGMSPFGLLGFPPNFHLKQAAIFELQTTGRSAPLLTASSIAWRMICAHSSTMQQRFRHN
jgi:hypothetical protein